MDALLLGKCCRVLDTNLSQVFNPGAYCLPHLVASLPSMYSISVSSIVRKIDTELDISVPHACTASCRPLPASNIIISSSSHLCCMAAAVQLLLQLL
jgi:hypothetical protein